MIRDIDRFECDRFQYTEPDDDPAPEPSAAMLLWTRETGAGEEDEEER